MRGGAIAVVARLLLIAYCAMTALFAFIVSSAFAYQQFIRPRVFRWIGAFTDLHPALSWVAVAAVLVLVWPLLRRSVDVTSREAQRPGATKVLAIAALAIIGVFAAVDSAAPILPSLRDGMASVVVGVLALVPLFVTGLLDHVQAWTWLTDQRAERPSNDDTWEGRLLVACAGAAVLLTAIYAVLAAAFLATAFEPDLAGAGLGVAVGRSLLDHLLVFVALFVTLAVARRAFGGSVSAQYVVVLALTGALFGITFANVVGASVGLPDLALWAASAATGGAVALTWGGWCLHRGSRRQASFSSGLGVFVAATRITQGTSAAVELAVLPLLAWALVRLSARMDWDFAVLRCGAVIVWVAALAVAYRVSPPRRVSTPVILLVCGVPLILQAVWRPGPAMQHSLDRYVVYNASFRVADGLLREPVEPGRFDRFLRANTGLTDVAVHPVAIDLAPGLTAAAADRRPLMFLLVVDSLRADYLSPYNPKVRFTPNIERFAADNLFLPNAFTKYGGTGMSMPAMFAGSALAHKQYVLPFGPMNSLEKLLDVNGYRRMMTRSHDVDELWKAHEDDVVIERGREEMQFDFCEAVDQMAAAIEGGIARGRPVFGFTRSLNLHVSAVRNGYVPPGKSYAGFEAPYAYRVERIDDCFGRFVARLKSAGVYDRSVVVLTADHGELIGEDGQWGHSYHLFPQVIQVPMFVHLPSSVEPGPIDRGAVTLSTDIVPTLYSVLGSDPANTGALAGRSLLEDGLRRSRERRAGDVVLSASYGAVYADLSRNGRQLYIADAIHQNDRLFVRSTAPSANWAERPVDAGMRALGQLRIRRFVDEVARTYGLDQPF